MLCCGAKTSPLFLLFKIHVLYFSSLNFFSMDEQKLIEYIRSAVHLWDYSHQDYKDLPKCKRSWECIEENPNVPVNDAKEKWRKLRDAYVRAKKVKSKSGDGGSHQVKWKYAEAISFQLISNWHSMCPVFFHKRTTKFQKIIESFRTHPKILKMCFGIHFSHIFY